MDAVDVHGLVKHFGRTSALDGLDLTVGSGEVLPTIGAALIEFRRRDLATA